MDLCGTVVITFEMTKSLTLIFILYGQFDSFANYNLIWDVGVIQVKHEYDMYQVSIVFQFFPEYFPQKNDES